MPEILTVVLFDDPEAPDLRFGARVGSKIVAEPCANVMQKAALALLAAGVSTDTRFRFIRSDGSHVTDGKCGGLATHFIVDPASSRNRRRAADGPRVFAVTARAPRPARAA
jgi:hypothetical protein